MCDSICELWHDCNHSRRYTKPCPAAQQEAKRASRSCCFGSTPRRVCKTRQQTHYAGSMCPSCTHQAEQRSEQAARRQVAQATRSYGWAGRSARDSVLEPGLIGQSMLLMSSGDFNRYVPPQGPGQGQGRRAHAPPQTQQASPAGMPARPPPVLRRGVSAVSLGPVNPGRVSPLGRGQFDYTPTRQTMLFDEVETMWKNAG